MFFAEKVIKLSDQSSITNKKKKDSLSISTTDQEKDSDYISQIDFTGSAADFSLPSVKRKRLTSRRASSKQSFDSIESHQTSGYSSLYSTSLSLSPRKSLNRTPKKRQFEETGSDENAFYNLDHFVSPAKFRKNEPNDNSKRAKLVLREKSSSENVILSSTPIRDSNKNKLWGRFRSLHPEKFDIGRSLDDGESIQKPLTLPKTSEVSFDYGSSFDFTKSFDLTSNVEPPNDNNIPSTLQQLWTGSLKQETPPKPQTVAVKSQPTETITKSQEQKFSPNLITRRKFYGGRAKLDICGMLHRENNLALDKIFSHLSDLDLLSLSHVSKEYKNMIKSNKSWDTKRRNYLNAHQNIKENKLPGTHASVLEKPVGTKNRKRAFADSNVNHSMELRSKPVTPPVSPSTKRFRDIQKITQSYSGILRKCPRCNRAAKVSTIQIRSSPTKRKKNRSILKMSTDGRGRVQKKNQTFLMKPSIDSFQLTDQLYVTFPILKDRSGSKSGSSSTSPSSEDSCTSGNESVRETQTCEYGECIGVACRFKFCIKCNCKFHPRQMCKELSPPSPSRGYSTKSSVACTRQSTKKLKRLTDYF